MAAKKKKSNREPVTSIFFSFASRAAFLLFSHATVAESFFWDLIINFKSIDYLTVKLLIDGHENHKDYFHSDRNLAINLLKQRKL